MLKAVIVGAGYMGRTHAEAYGELEGAEVCAIVDSKPESGRALADKAGCLYHEKLDAALKARCDFVDICTPTKFHKQAIYECFDAGKDVICEKPLSLSPEEAEEIALEAERRGRAFMVAHVVQFFPEYKTLSGLIKSGEIRDIKYLTLYRYGPAPDWSEGGWMLHDGMSGGIVFDLAIHEINFAVSLFGMPEFVFARRSLVGEDYTAYVNALLGYGEMNLLIESGFIMPRGYPFTCGFRLSCVDSAVEFRNTDGRGMLLYRGAEAPARLPCPAANPYAEELRHFTGCLGAGIKPTIATGREAALSVKLASLIQESAKYEDAIYL